MWILQSSDNPDAAEAQAAQATMTFRLIPGTIKTIGRATGADFVVDAALVSRLHCQLTATEDAIDVEDLSSTNGTFVNDQRVQRARLASGDRLRVGRIELKVEKN